MLDEKCMASQRVFYTWPYRQDDARTNYRISGLRVIVANAKTTELNF